MTNDPAHKDDTFYPVSNVDELAYSVLIVNFNGQRYLPACLAALEVQTVPRHLFEVVIVDNASTDGSADAALAAFPWIRLVKLPRNLGFAGGNNAGLPYLRGRYVVLLNNDTIPDPHWLEELAAEARPGVAVASKLVFAGDPTMLNSAGLQLLRDGRGYDLGFRTKDDGRFEATRPIFAGCAAALLIDRQTIGNRLFDSRFFMYSEDLDAGWKAQLQGRETIFAPRSLVRHVHGGSAGDESPLFRFHVERNRTLASVQNGDILLAIFAVFGQGARLVRSFVRFALGRDRRELVTAQTRALVSTFWHLPRALVIRSERRAHPEAYRCAS